MPQTSGIIPYANGLLIANSRDGGVYYLDLTDESVAEVVPQGGANGGDGFAMDKNDVLYIAQGSFANQLSVWNMSNVDGIVSAAFHGLIKSPDYDSPATVRIYNDKIYAVNAAIARLGIKAPGEGDLATFNESFAVIGVDRFDFVDPPEESPSPTGAPTSLAAIWGPATVVVGLSFYAAFMII